MEIQCFKDILDFLKNHKNIKSLKDLSDKTGNNYTYLSELNTGRKPLTELFVQSINRKFNTDFELTEDNKNISLEAPGEYNKTTISNLETLKILEKQLDMVNKLLMRALENESKALSMLEKKLNDIGS